jgi:hypothetical protein
MRHNLESMTFRLLICICMTALGASAIAVTAQASGRTGRSVAKAAKRVNLIEVAHLKLSKEEGSAIIEHGHATGTYNAPMTASFTTHPKSVTVVVTLHPRGGSITGTANANYKVVKGLGYFGGNFTVGRGTGKYRHVSEVNGKALGFSGIINRTTLEAEVKVNRGEINL